MADDQKDVPAPQTLLKPLCIQAKTLMGPGPSNPHPRITQAMALPLLGHFHEATFEVMEEIKKGLQYIFQTQNSLTLALSTSGHGGMEAAMCNLVEPGDIVLVLVNGIWGQRAADMAKRYGGHVVPVTIAAGTNFTLTQIHENLTKYHPQVLFVTQGESSTGVLQPIQGVGNLCKQFNCLLVVDTVASLGGVPFYADKWCVDCVYTGSQKTLGAPPGLAPISFSERAVTKINSRKVPPSVFYFDMQPLGQYWGCYPNLPRIYHHTISTPMLYALREALALLAEEGLENCINRHQDAAAELHRGLKELSLEFFVKDPDARLPTVTTVKVPAKVDWVKLLRTSINKYDLELAGGLGPTAGKVLRIGVMGTNAYREKIAKCLSVLKLLLNKSQL